MKKFFTIFLVLIIPITSTIGQKVSLQDVQTNIGQTVTVCGKIFGGRFVPNAVNTPTLLNMGGGSPNHSLTLVIFAEDLKEFPPQPEVHYANQQVCVTGTVMDYKGQPEIILKSPAQIKPDIPNSTSSVNIPKDTTNKSTGITNNTTSNKRGITLAAAANKPVVTTNGIYNSPVATSDKKLPATSANTAQYDIKLTQDVYMRSGPTFEYPLVTTVKAGTVVTILSSSSGWSQVVIKDKDSIQGYIKNSVLK